MTAPEHSETRRPTPRPTVLHRREARRLWKANAVTITGRKSGIYGKRKNVRNRNLPRSQEN